MTRSAMLLTALLAVVLLVLSYLFLIKPKMDEVTELEAQATEIEDQQAEIRAQIADLEQVRADSPEVEAELAAISSIVPDTPALPSALRQLQTAADTSGVNLISVAPGRPSSAGVEALPRLSRITLNLALEGGYFQVVDFLRRIDDPLITARGILIRSVSVAPAEYPTLTVNISAEMFAMLDQPVAAQPEPAPTETGEPTEGETDEAEEAAA